MNTRLQLLEGGRIFWLAAPATYVGPETRGIAWTGTFDTTAQHMFGRQCLLMFPGSDYDVHALLQVLVVLVVVYRNDTPRRSRIRT